MTERPLSRSVTFAREANGSQRCAAVAVTVSRSKRVGQLAGSVVGEKWFQGTKNFTVLQTWIAGTGKYAGITAIIYLSVTLEIFDRRRRASTTYTVRSKAAMNFRNPRRGIKPRQMRLYTLVAGTRPFAGR
jgi:hypothetical protein